MPLMCVRDFSLTDPKQRCEDKLPLDPDDRYKWWIVAPFHRRRCHQLRPSILLRACASLSAIMNWANKCNRKCTCYIAPEFSKTSDWMRTSCVVTWDALSYCLSRHIMGPMLLRVGVLSVCVLVMCVLPIVSGRVELPYFRASNCYLLPVMFVCVCV